jgi:hypothetical protein
MYQKHIFKRSKIAYKMYNFTMRHHFRRPQAMFLIMDHCSIVTVGRLNHTFWRGPPRRKAATAAEEHGRRNSSAFAAGHSRYRFSKEAQN